MRPAWYIVNFAHGLHTALNAGSAETARVYRTGDALPPADIAHYLRDAANCAPAIYLVVLAVTLLVCYPAASKNASRGLALSAVWAGPLVLLALGHYRDLRYAAPLFPALALALGILLDSAIARYGAFAGEAACLLLGLGVASMLQTSFGVRPFEFGGLLFVQPRFSYASRPDSAVWPYRDVLRELYQSAKFTGDERKKLAIGNDTLHFNVDNFNLEALSAGLPFDGASTAYETDPSRMQQTLASASYFLYKEGREQESPFNSLGAEAIAAVRPDANFAEMGTRSLPDGGLLHLFRKVPADRLRQERAFLPPGQIGRAHV